MGSIKTVRSVFGVVTLFAIFTFTIYFVTQNQRLSIDNFASSNTIPLDEKIASQVSVFGVSENSRTKTRYKFRVEIPSSFVFTPTAFVISNMSLDAQLEKTTASYECIDMVDWDRNILAFESVLFEASNTNSLTGSVDIIFTDDKNISYRATYPIQIDCTIFGNDYSQGIQISPDPKDTIPEE